MGDFTLSGWLELPLELGKRQPDSPQPEVAQEAAHSPSQGTCLMPQPHYTSSCSTDPESQNKMLELIRGRVAPLEVFRTAESGGQRDVLWIDHLGGIYTHRWAPQVKAPGAKVDGLNLILGTHIVVEY